MSLTRWAATVIPSQECLVGDRIYTLYIVCGVNYPEEPPKIQFKHKVPAIGDVINREGHVNVKSSSLGCAWNREKFIMDVRQRRNPRASSPTLFDSLPIHAQALISIRKFIKRESKRFAAIDMH